MNFKTLSIFAAAAAMSLASCSSEEPAGNQMQEGEGIGYMSFTIANPAEGTRAAGDQEAGSGKDNEIFNNGDANEYAICPNNQANAAFFYDEDGTFYSMSYLQAFNATGDGHQSHDNYAEKYYTYITRWANTNAKPVPTQVVVVLNADPEKLLELANLNKADFCKTIYDTMDKTTKAYTYGIYKYGDEKYFTMSNSAFYDDKDATVTDIANYQVCETAEDALKNPVTVYVERLLAKFQLTFGENGKELIDGDDFVIFDPVTPDGKAAAKVNFVAKYDGLDDNLDYPDYESVEWKIYISNWGINGLEKQANLLKNISEKNNATFPLDYWNAKQFHRSYWGFSPDFATEEGFTTQYRYAGYDPEAETYKDKFFGNADYNPANESAQLNTLHYVSFNDLKARARYKYTAERTYNAKAGLENYGPYRFASHYLVAAQLMLPNVDTDMTTKNDKQQLENLTDKWYAYNFFWATKEDYIRYAYRRMATMVTDGREHSMTINGITASIKGVSDGYLYYKEYEGDQAVFKRIEVANATDYFETQSAQVIHGDGKIALKAKKGASILIRTGENSFTKLTDDQLTCMIYSFSEPAKHFAKGAMYYAIPVQHYYGKSFPNDDDKAVINKDSGEYYEGQFGVVRNHWYRLNIKNIGSIGIPVDNPDQPIIPDPEDEYYIALEIVVLPWHVIDNGSVDL